jgi:hypothetical protein
MSTLAKLADVAETIAYGYVALYALAALLLYVGRRWPAKKAPAEPAQRQIRCTNGHAWAHVRHIDIAKCETCGEVRS